MSYKTFITGRLTANKLTLNDINKTTFVIFHPCQKRRAYQPKLCMFDNEKNKYVRLEPKVYIKYLSVLIDQNLSFKYHIDSIVTKISKNVVWYRYNETSKLHPAVCSWIWGELSLQYRFCREGNQSKLLQCRRLQTERQSTLISGAPNDRFLGNICSEPSRMAKIFESPRTAKNFENVSWWLFVGLRVSGFVWFVHLRISDFVVISRSPRNFVAFVN